VERIGHEFELFDRKRTRGWEGLDGGWMGDDVAVQSSMLIVLIVIVVVALLFQIN